MIHGHTCRIGKINPSRRKTWQHSGGSVEFVSLGSGPAAAMRPGRGHHRVADPGTLAWARGPCRPPCHLPSPPPDRSAIQRMPGAARTQQPDYLPRPIWTAVVLPGATVTYSAPAFAVVILVKPSGNNSAPVAGSE